MTQPRAAIYCRVSSDGQEDNTSLETQLERCQQYAAGQGWEVVATYREVASGADLHERKELAKARTLITNGGADILLGYALDRISRNQNHAGYLLTEIERAGAELALATESFEDTVMGRMARVISSVMADFEREKIIERTTRGRRARAENKGKLLPGAKPPYGLQWGDEDKTHLIRDPATAPLLVRMFTTIANGGSATGVAKAFTLEGIPTPKGLNVPWRQTTITKMLRNPIYTGKVEAFRHKRTKAKGQRRDGSIGKVVKITSTPESERVLFPDGTAPVLIPDATFAAVQSQLSVNKNQSTRNNRNPETFLLRAGFATCGYCGNGLLACWNARKGEEIGRPFYECNIANRTAHGCPSSRISAKALDHEVEARLMMVLEDEAFVRKFVEPQLRESGIQFQVAEVDKAIAERAKKIANLLGSLEYLEGQAAADTGARITALGRERESLLAQRTQLHAAKASDDGRKSDLDKLFRTLEMAQRHSQELTYEGKRKWLEALGFEVRVWAKGHEPHWEITSSIDPSFWELSPWDTGEETPENTPNVWPVAGTGEILSAFVTPTLPYRTAR